MYDSTGSRVKKTEGSTTAIYFGKDYEKEGSNTTKHIFLGDRRISTKKYDGSTHTTEYIHGDHINSSNIITDSSGNQSALLEYSPYGETVTHTGTSSPKHKFTGQEEDDSTGLYYYGARFYDPQLGRFITPDWIVADPTDPQSFNRYSYALNNPVKYTDPTGNFPWLAFAIFFAIVALATGVAAAIAANNGHHNAARTLGIISMSAAVLSVIMSGAAIVTAPEAAITTAGAADPVSKSATGVSTASGTTGAGTGGEIGAGAVSAATNGDYVANITMGEGAFIGHGTSSEVVGLSQSAALANPTVVLASEPIAQGINTEVAAFLISAGAGMTGSAYTPQFQQAGSQFVREHFGNQGLRRALGTPTGQKTLGILADRSGQLSTISYGFKQVGLSTGFRLAEIYFRGVKILADPTNTWRSFFGKALDFAKELVGEQIIDEIGSRQLGDVVVDIGEKSIRSSSKGQLMA